MLKNYTGNLRSLGRAYPRQFWLLMAGTLINTIGVGFGWPFLTIYLTDELGIALSLPTMLPLMEQSVALVAALLAGSVDAIRFEIGRSEIVGYLGPNGAGKSTTLKMLCGLLVPTSGTALVDGFVPWKERQAYVSRLDAVFGQRTTFWWEKSQPLDWTSSPKSGLPLTTSAIWR